MALDAYGLGPVGWLAFSTAAGLLAAVVMALPMSRQTEGFTPAYVAAGVVTRRDPGSVPFRDAFVVHHLAGALGGLLYGLVALALDAAVPTVVPVGGVPLVPHVLATAFVVVFVYLFFAHLVLPWAGGAVYEQDATTVTGQWLRSAVVFGVALGVLVPLATAAA